MSETNGSRTQVTQEQWSEVVATVAQLSSTAGAHDRQLEQVTRSLADVGGKLDRVATRLEERVGGSVEALRTEMRDGDAANRNRIDEQTRDTLEQSRVSSHRSVGVVATVVGLIIAGLGIWVQAEQAAADRKFDQVLVAMREDRDRSRARHDKAIEAIGKVADRLENRTDIQVGLGKEVALQTARLAAVESDAKTAIAELISFRGTRFTRKDWHTEEAKIAATLDTRREWMERQTAAEAKQDAQISMLSAEVKRLRDLSDSVAKSRFTREDWEAARERGIDRDRVDRDEATKRDRELADRISRIEAATAVWGEVTKGVRQEQERRREKVEGMPARGK